MRGRRHGAQEWYPKHPLLLFKSQESRLSWYLLPNKILGPSFKSLFSPKMCSMYTLLSFQNQREGDINDNKLGV